VKSCRYICECKQAIRLGVAKRLSFPVRCSAEWCETPVMRGYYAVVYMLAPSACVRSVSGDWTMHVPSASLFLTLTVIISPATG
jgi:hypothetical protein